jgi:hypothetical protein
MVEKDAGKPRSVEMEDYAKIMDIINKAEVETPFRLTQSQSQCLVSACNQNLPPLVVSGDEAMA